MSINEVATNQSFLRLEDLLLSPPLPAIVSLLIVLGTLNLSRWGTRWLRLDNKTLPESAAAFVLTTGLLAALLHALAWAGYVSPAGLRWIGWLLVSLGVLELSRWKPGKLASVVGEYWRSGATIERCALTLCIVVVIGLFAAALGPATDADSLEYHLGVPLDWLRHGGSYPRPDWFQARLAGGLGESLNMLGLAMGTDGLGAAFQAAGLIVALVGVTALAKTRADQRFAILLVVVCPVIATMITAQKAQLLPTAALTVALVILVQRFNTFNLPTAFLVFGCAVFAMGSKHSYLLTGGIVVLVGLIAALRTRQLHLALLAFACCFAILAAPVFARNFVFYGDPISPFLERWRPGGDPALIAYAEKVRNWGGGPITVQRVARLPLDLLLGPYLGLVHEAYGLGTFAFFLGFRERGPVRQLLLAALAAFGLVVALGQLTGRFFLEPYLWSAAAVAGVPSRPLKSFFFLALTAQAVVAAGVAVYLGVILFPGALTQTQREQAITVMAQGYSAAKWLDATLPPDAVVLEEFRWRALLPRPYVVADRFVLVTDPNWKPRLTALVEKNQVTALVTQYPIQNPSLMWLANRYGTPLAGPAKFREGARSPFNRYLSEWIVFRINVNGPPS